MRLLLLIIGLAVLCQPCNGGHARMEKEIVQVIRDYENAVNNPNPVLWLSIWDLEYDGLTILENDKPQQLGKAYVEQIAKWMENAKPDRRQTWHSNEVFFLDADLAYAVSLRTEHSKAEKEQESRISMVLRKTNGKWKIIHCHFSFTPQP